MSLYEINDLRVAFPDLSRKPLVGPAPRTEVLHGLSFDIPRGQIVGIVGESGSGKSTLGRAMVRLLEPDSGTIRFDGQDITHMSDSALRPLRRRMQMIFQDPMSSLNPRQTIRQLIRTPLAIRGERDASAQAAAALDRVGLPAAMLGRYAHELSGGQRQRIGIARAIAQRPEFILADEIASGLDVSSQARVLSVLQDLVRDMDLTLAFISHDLSVVRRLCDRVIVMQAGRIVEDAPVGQLFDAPQTEYTRTLLDAIPLPVLDQQW